MKDPRFNHRTSSDAQPTGFTLLEMIIVMSVVILLASLTAPAFVGVLASIHLNGAANRVVDVLESARQTAITNNEITEVRVYRGGATSAEFRRLAVLMPGNPGSASDDDWQTTAEELEGDVIFDDSTSYSTLLAQGAGTETSTTAPDGLDGLDYRSFRFRPDGSIDLPADEAWSLVLRSSEGRPGPSGTPAANYVAIVLDPITGRALTFRP